MKKNNILKVVTGSVACLAMVCFGSYCYNTQAVGGFEKKLETNAPIIFNEVSSYDTKYDFSDNSVLAEYSDLIVIGKVTNLDDATNYNPKTQKYSKARTPGNLEILNVLKSDGSKLLSSIDFLDVGGTLSYSEYEKSLLPAQKAKRDYLMQQNGISTKRNNIYVKQSVENQLDLEEGKTYIMYLKYDENFEKYTVVNQPYGVKEYNVNTKQILNHVTNTIENIDEMM